MSPPALVLLLLLTTAVGAQVNDTRENDARANDLRATNRAPRRPNNARLATPLGTKATCGASALPVW